MQVLTVFAISVL